MKVVLACNFPKDERLGSSRVPLRLAAELGKLDVAVRLVFADDLPRVTGVHLQQVTSPIRMAQAVWGPGADADVVDIAGFDAAAYAVVARRLRRHQAIVSRSNGLWDKALAVNGDTGASRLRRAASWAFQKKVLCGFERESITRADLAIFGAREDADEVVRRGWKSADAVAVVPLGVDDFFASGVPIEDRTGVAFVGTFLHRKGSDIVAAAMTRVLHDRPAERLSIMGPGMTTEQVLSAFAPGVRAQVDVIPAVAARDLGAALGRYAILLFPTRYEGFGLVVLEAMRAGLAVVTTPTGAGADIVRHGENGLLVPFGNPGATAAAVTRLLDDPSLRCRLARAATSEATERGWDRTAADLERAYRTAQSLARRRQTP